MGVQRRSGSRTTTAPARCAWARRGDESLLNLRLCDLGLRIEGSVLERRIARLHEEMDARGLRFRPHCWLSTEWFSPVGVPGIAIPFYLAHPRLVRLEETMMLEAEGGSAQECMKILRHEAGHAMDHAYRLSRRPRWRRMFGSPARAYPDSYRPRPYSRRFVLHLDNWYAQSHPTEDFAETFAVWLTPGSAWRRRYAGWPALEKLEYVDELMAEIGQQAAPVQTRRQVDNARRLEVTLRELYEDRQARYGAEDVSLYDRDLRRMFSGDVKGYEAASVYLRRARPRLRLVVSRWTGAYQYTVDGVIEEMISRSRALKLRRHRSREETFSDAVVMLTVQTMNQMSGGRPRYLL
ncbi:MAG: putative zinc-binding metallopeptidase [Phycisphaerales bacterium]|nr:putative zinc-binding metallopeptidase [Phycisphaerales bacterium]